MMFSVDYPYSANEKRRAFPDHLSLAPADSHGKRTAPEAES
jgi:hypothetical protein